MLRAANGERRGEISFARATGDVRQKQIGGYATPMADVRAKNISPLQIDDRVREDFREHIDDWQWSGWRSGDGVPSASVGAKYFSPVQMDDWRCEEVCVYLDDRQRPGRRSGNGVPSANVGAKNISPVQMDGWGYEEVCACLDGECAAVWKPSPFLVCRA